MESDRWPGDRSRPVQGRRAPGRRAPGPRHVPLVDWRAPAAYLLQDPVLHLLRLQRRYGDVVALGARQDAPVCVFGAQYNRQLLTDPALFYSLDVTDSEAPLKVPTNTAAARLLSGVTGMNGARHKQHRRMLLPAFHRERVALLRDAVVSTAQKHTARWHVGQQIDLKGEMIELSLSLAIEGLLGLDPEEDGRHVRRLLGRWREHGMSTGVTLLPFDAPGLPYRRFLGLATDLEDALRAVIERKRARGWDGHDALSMLLQARDIDGKALTDDELVGHLATLFTAGHETTASVLTWILFLLSQHPDITVRLREELDLVADGDAPRLEHLDRLPLLAHVIDEGLRMFPPGMWMLRTSTAPFALGEYELARGTHLVFSPAVTHYRPDIYTSPHRFMPQRWEAFEPSPYEYLPFGNGPRRCLGAPFAMLELQMVLALIVRRFHPTVPANTRVDRGGIVLSFPKRAIPVVLQAPGQRRHTRTPGLRGNILDLVHLAPSH